MIIQKKMIREGTIRIEVMGMDRDLSTNEKAFLEYIASWCSGVLSTKNEGFTVYAIRQLGTSLDMCSAYLKNYTRGM